jgi:hypothetical protein
MNVNPNECLVWKTPAEVAFGNDLWRITSDRTNGQYKVTDSAVSALESLTVEQRAVLTTWLIDQRRFGDSCPRIDTYNLEKIASRRAR